MKKFLVVLLVLAMTASLAVTGFASDMTKTKVVDVDVVKNYQPGVYGGYLRIAATQDPKTFNPITAKETSSTDILQFFFESLTSTDGVTTAVIPGLAKSWEFSKDGLTWTFHLRRGVTWHDGHPFTADDVVFTFDVIYDEKVPTSSRDSLTIDGEKLKVRKIDDYTVEIKLPKPFAPLLRQLPWIIPKHKLEKAWKEGRFTEMWGVNTKPTEIIGTGPFALADYKPGQRVVAIRNANYWRVDSKGNALPYLTRLIWSIVPNAETAILKFKNGELDIVGIPGDQVKEFSDPAAMKKGNYTVYNGGPDFGNFFFVFNMNPRAPWAKTAPYKLEWFQNKYFRQAMSYALDRKTITDVVYAGNASDMWGPVSLPNKEYLKPDLKQYPYDLNKAVETLKKGGFVQKNGKLYDSKGNQVKFTIYSQSNSQRVANLVNIFVEDLAKIGIDAQFVPIDFNTLVGKLTDNFDWECIYIGLTGGVEVNSGKNVWTSNGHLHMWNPVQESPMFAWEKEIDEIFNKGVQIMDPQQRIKHYYRWQDIVAEEQPLIYTPIRHVFWAVRNTLHNMKPTAYGGSLHNVESIFFKK